MTISVFNQLYEQKPFDLNFNINAELWGKVNRKDTYLVFRTTTGVRICNIAEFDRPIKPIKLSASIGKALSIRDTSFELEHMRSKLRDFYYDMESEEDSMYRFITELTTNPYYKSDDRDITLFGARAARGF